MTLTKAGIIDSVSEKGYAKNQSTRMMEVILEIVKGALEKGEDVLISGFGKFCVKEKKRRRGRNPATGADLFLNERRIVTFRCSPKLRDRINDRG